MPAKTTKTNQKRPTGRKRSAADSETLTPRQQKAIPLIVTSPTYTAACQRARIHKTTLYKWLKIEAFKAELERQRDAVTQEAFGILSQSLTKAVETLADLLDDKARD